MLTGEENQGEDMETVGDRENPGDNCREGECKGEEMETTAVNARLTRRSQLTFESNPHIMI